MDRIAQLKRNPRLLFWGRALIEFKALNAIVVLFYLHRELSIDEIFYLSIVFSISTLIFEIPSGYLADLIGRKRTLILGVFALLCSFIATWFAHGFLSFILIFILLSASFSAFSGTEEAMLYDTLKELGEEKNMTKHNGRLHTARHIMKIFIPTLAAFIAKDLLEWQFKIVIGMDFVGGILAIITLALLVEPKHLKDVAVYEKGIFLESIKTIRQEPLLFRAAMNKIIIFIASFIIWRMYQPFLADHGVSVIWLGLFYVFMNIGIVGIQWFLGQIEDRVGAPRILGWTIFIFMASAIGAIFTNTAWLLFILLLIAAIAPTIREPVFAHAMNKRIASRSRATTLSNLNAIKAVLDIPILLLCGWLALQNLKYVFVIAVVLCFAVLIFFPIRKRDLVAVR